MDEYEAKCLRIVCFEGFGQEEDEAPIHVLQSETSQVKDETALAEGWLKEETTGFQRVYSELLERCGRLSTGAMKFDVDVEDWSILLVGTVEISLSGFHLGDETRKTIVVDRFTLMGDLFNTEANAPLKS